MPFDHGWAPFNHGLALFNHGVASFNHRLAQFNHPRPPEQQRAVAVIPVTSVRIYHQGAKRRLTGRTAREVRRKELGVRS
jgi:hypothetical protein